MPHVRTQIRDAIETALSSLVVTQTVFIERKLRVSASDFPAVAVEMSGDETEADMTVMGSPFVVETSQAVMIEFHANGPDGKAVSETIDAMQLEVEAALAADLTLGGILENLVPVGSQVEYSTDQDTVVGVRAAIYNAIWRSAFGSPDTPEG